MTVRSLMRFVSRLEHESGTFQLKFCAVYDNSIPEHVRFQKATPYGEVTMTVDNSEALKQFELGKYYYLDFSPFAGLTK